MGTLERLVELGGPAMETGVAGRQTHRGLDEVEGAAVTTLDAVGLGLGEHELDARASRRQEGLHPLEGGAGERGPALGDEVAGEGEGDLGVAGRAGDGGLEGAD